MEGTVLLADDDRTIRTVLSQALTRAGCKVHATASLATLQRWVEEGKGDVVISDVVMPDGNGLETLPKISARRPGLPVIVISAQNTVMTAIQATAADAYDYLPKPFDLPDLLKRVQRALAAADKTPVQRQPAAPLDDLPLVGKSQAMQDLYKVLARVMNSEIPIVITGESGTGKSLMAKVMHDYSNRRDRPLVSAGTASLNSEHALAASMSEAKHGTLILEEVGDFTESTQALLVQAIDTLSPDDVRIIATSQKDLELLTSSGQFREDLFYRLNGVPIHIPPLRSRIEDIPVLADQFLLKASGDRTGRSISDGAHKMLREQTWPGNLRQLENHVNRLAILCPGTEIAPADVESLLDARAPSPEQKPGEARQKLAATVEGHLRRYFDLHGSTLPPPGMYNRILREIEMPLIELALDATNGNQAKCAALLGINRNTLRKKITELDIRVTRGRKLM